MARASHAPPAASDPAGRPPGPGPAAGRRTGRRTTRVAPVPVPYASRGERHHPGNTLNDLSGRAWLRFTKSWFVYDGPQRSPHELLHPAKFPEGMISDFVRFFSKSGEVVLDPFMGTGSTLVACQATGRRGIGLELLPKYARIAQGRTRAAAGPGVALQLPLIGDARALGELWARRRLPPVDFAITSPPYWNMLRTSRGGVLSTQRLRGRAGLDTHYSESGADLGNVPEYDQFVQSVAEVFGHVATVLRPGRYVVVIAQNLRDREGAVRPLAWDLAKEIGNSTPLVFQGERIWCQDSKRLGIWGYPTIFVPNYHHHYCMIFRSPPVGRSR